MKPRPPHNALKFLHWFCREDYIEEIEGDLTEIFEKQYEQSPGKAKRKFTWSVIRYFRPAFMKSFKKHHTNHTAMFRHNFLISYRNFKRYKGSFFVNLAGLSTGLACALLIYLWVKDELSIDKFHENDSRLYQVLKNSSEGDGSISTFETTPILMAQTMAEDLPEVEHSVSVIRRDNGIVSSGEKHVKAKQMFADKDFFKVFSYKLIQGNKDKALTNKNEVLLSDQLAMKLFNTTENIIGKTIEWQWWPMFDGTYTVAGIFGTPGTNSSAQFDLLFAHALWIDRNNRDTYWGSNNAFTYVVLKEGTNVKDFGDKIRDYSRKKYEQLHGKEGLKWEGTLLLQRYSDRYLYTDFKNGIQAESGERIQYVKLFSIIAIFILIIACINFMNLSTAKASRRIKEVGIKKAVGAQRGALVLQYISESMIMTFLSLITALLLVYLLLPSFKEITGKNIVFSFDTNMLLSLACITLVTGVISGSYPALYLSGFNPVLVLKGLLKTSAGESWVRKGLVVFQFTVSVILIVSVVVVYKQIQFIGNKNLGFNKDNVIKFSNEGKLRKSLTTFLDEVRKMPGVVNATSMGGDLVGSHGGGGGIDWEGKDPNTGIEFSALNVDYNLIEMLDLKMAEGRSFSPESGSGVEKDKVIFNQTAIDMMKLKDPVGKTVTMWGEQKQIIGVVKNFHYESLYERVGPLFFRFSENNGKTLIKIKAGMEQETLDRISRFYREYNQDLPFEYQFLDQDFEVLYAAENRVAILSKYFACVAILISCLGLFGLAAFTAERRTKEIGIRKILGSNEFGIVYLLSKDFTKMVLLAIVIGLPVSYLMTKNWLDHFAFSISLEWWFFIGAGAAALIIAWLTVGIHTIKAARVNPVQCIKND